MLIDGDTEITVDLTGLTQPKDQIVKILSDGQNHSTRQITDAITEYTRSKSYKLNAQKVRDACANLVKWGRVERIDAYGVTYWRLVQ